MSLLKISTDLSLPRDFITQTAAILARKRSGKTYTASVIAEELVQAGLPFTVLDPTGAWYGLRASSDGKHPGLPVVVLGGVHGDLSIEPTSGAAVADLVVDRQGFYVLDLSTFDSNAQQDRFACDFAERLYRRKAKEHAPLHLFVDEADCFVPQSPMPAQMRLLGAFDTLVRRGGSRGVGVTLISQRPAVVSKNVLSQCELLIALQTLGAHDRKAIDAWVSAHGTEEQRDALLGSLATLKLGEAWIWSPSWLGVFEKIKIRVRYTFNSSRTPEPGEKPISPAALAPVDVESIRERLGRAVEEPEKQDAKPAARIRELEAEVVKLRQERTTIAAARDATAARMVEIVRSACDGLVSELREKFSPPRPSRPDPAWRDADGTPMQEKKLDIRLHSDSIKELTRPQLAIAAAVQWWEPHLADRAFSPPAPTREQVAFLVSVSPTSGGFKNNLGALRSIGLIEYPSPGTVCLGKIMV